MSPAGLERKFDTAAYVTKVEDLAEGKGHSGNGG